MTRPITAHEAQVARISWVLHEGAKAAGIPLSAATMQKLTLAMSAVMTDTGMFFDYQARVDREASAMEQDTT